MAHTIKVQENGELLTFTVEERRSCGWCRGEVIFGKMEGESGFRSMHSDPLCPMFETEVKLNGGKRQSTVIVDVDEH